MNKSTTSYIEDYEEEEAKGIVKEQLGFDPIKPFHKRIAVKIYLRPEEISTITTDDGREISIYLPPSICATDKFKNCTGLVIYVHEDCYKDEKYELTGPYCKAGDWIVFPRNVGTQVNYRGIPVQLIPEASIFCVIEDPTHIERNFGKTKAGVKR